MPPPQAPQTSVAVALPRLEETSTIGELINPGAQTRPRHGGLAGRGVPPLQKDRIRFGCPLPGDFPRPLARKNSKGASVPLPIQPHPAPPPRYPTPYAPPHFKTL